MFAQIYFGGISSTLLSFLPEELKEYFKNHTCFPSLSLSIPLFPLFSFLAPLSVLLSSLTYLDGMDFIWHGKGRCAQDLLRCSADPWLSQHPLTLQTGAAATDVETSLYQLRAELMLNDHLLCIRKG